MSRLHSIIPLVVLLVSSLTIVVAQTCNSTSVCPSTAPCCSEYGFCGSGAYCLGGCEPLYSYKPTSCLPNPICQSYTSILADYSGVQTNASAYKGNVTAYDWVVNTGHIVANEDGIRLVLIENGGGTKISSTRYIHYGSIDFVMETSKWAGVVTAAITMSDVKDEIDFEWPGTKTFSAQTNYWYLGIANYSATQGSSVDVSSDTSSNFHTYSLDWQEDYLNWLVDGNVVRTVFKSDTLSPDGTYKYPSTPSRIQISIWPAGISTSAQGTIDWAGGMINWQDPDYLSNGYFWNTVKSVKVSCANEGLGDGSTGWMYQGNTTSVAVTNGSVMLSSAQEAVDVPRRVLLSLLGGFSWMTLLGTVSLL